jgi:predicted phosphodiesterase
MRVLFVGDSHRNSAFMAKAFEVAHVNHCEKIIQLGDFGFGWEWLKLTDSLAICKFSAAVSLLVEKTGIEVLFLDGNHENFDALLSIALQPDGRREVAPGVFHLPRGHRFEIDGCSFLVCGGAVSVDKLARQEGVSWWSQEAITDEDVVRCGDASVNVLLTHDAPWQTTKGDHIHRSGYGMSADIETYLNRLRIGRIVEATSPSLVVHGHLHRRYYQERSTRYPQEIVGLGADKGELRNALLIFETSSRTFSMVSDR